MPRQMRDLGKTGWAHIILRGINRENLFYDEQDYERFFETVERFQKECDAQIAIICLMSNHVHMLLYMDEADFARIMKKISVSYAAYYNAKYDRVGHVFQDRFRSEPVNDEKYLMIALRYIYQNPNKVGKSAADYPYTRIDRKGILSEYFHSESELMKFLNEDEAGHCMDYDSNEGCTDAEAIEWIKKLTGFDNPQLLQSMDKKEGSEILRKLKWKGISVRQLSRLTGINRNVIQRA